MLSRKQTNKNTLQFKGLKTKRKAQKKHKAIKNQGTSLHAFDF